MRRIAQKIVSSYNRKATSLRRATSLWSGDFALPKAFPLQTGSTGYTAFSCVLCSRRRGLRSRCALSPWPALTVLVLRQAAFSPGQGSQARRRACCLWGTVTFVVLVWLCCTRRFHQEWLLKSLQLNIQK